jgi:beta-aspartyl-dipeptidase (metallo-type)
MAMVVVVLVLLLCGLLCECGDAGASDSMLLITNGHLYTPLPRGSGSLLTGGGSVVAVLPEDYPVENLTGLPVRVVDAGGGFVVPGLIDIHVHVTGGGGEMGPASRTPEATVAELVDAGITTVVGVLGTDCVSRRLTYDTTNSFQYLEFFDFSSNVWSSWRSPSSGST